jgi:uncharacterized membrane protein
MTTPAPRSPPPSAPGPGDLPPSVYERLANVLGVGLVIALGLLAVALAVLVARSPHSASAGWISTNPLVRYLDLGALGRGLASGSPEAFLTLGVYALVATPVVRVVTGAQAFLEHGERRLGALTLVVLALLLVGLFVVGPLVR